MLSFIDWRLALISYQDDNTLLLTLAGRLPLSRDECAAAMKSLIATSKITHRKVRYGGGITGNLFSSSTVPGGCYSTYASGWTAIYFNENKGCATSPRKTYAQSTHYQPICTSFLRVFPLCALVPRAQGSSGAVATVQFVWRGHAKTPTTRAGPWPDFALRLE